MALRTLAGLLLLAGLAATTALAQNAPSPRFLHLGYPLGDENIHLEPRQLRAYKKALAAYPDSGACLTAGSGHKTASLRLNQFSSLEQLEVCLFLTADTLRDPDQMRALLARSGFRVEGDTPYPASAMLRLGTKGEGVIVGGGMPDDEVPSGLIGWFDLMAYSLSISVLFGPDGTPVNTQAVINRL